MNKLVPTMLLLLALPAVARGQWQEARVIGIRTDSPASAQAIFLNTHTGIMALNGVKQPDIAPPNVFQTLDLTPLGIPPNTIGVFMSCELVISDGQTSDLPDLAVGFQAPGGPWTALWPASGLITPYNFQAIGIGPTGGARTGGSAVVAVADGKIKWAWIRGDGSTWPAGPIPDWPTGAAYGINCSVQAYFADPASAPKGAGSLTPTP